MSDYDASSKPSPIAPGSPHPPRTTGGNWRWEPPSAEDLQALMPGYTIEKILGRGGMGAVYRGVQTNLDRPVAIKILPPGVEKEDPSFAERFKSEARLMAKLNHPAVVAVYDFGTTLGGQLYFAMEYVDGSDVSHMLSAQGRLPPEHALAITAHVCDALAAAHELGIVHRDIKPANVLINMKGQVKVADFGLAKVEEPGTHGLTKTGYAMGTPDYVSPEALMLGTAIDGRADIYAVGVMLYQMLTGQIPRGAWQPASVVAPGVDRRFDAIITKAMQYDREHRHRDAMELRRELDVILTVPIVQQDAPVRPVVPESQVAKVPGPRSAAQKPVGKGPSRPQGGADTPVRQPAAPAGKSARSASSASKSKASLFLGIGAVAVVGIGVFAMLSGGKQHAPTASEPAASVATAPPATAASTTPKKKSSAAPDPKPMPTLEHVPPGEWVKVINRAEDLPDELRAQGVTFKDGWIIPSRPCMWVVQPKKSWKSMSVRFRTKVAGNRMAIPIIRHHPSPTDEGRGYRFDISPTSMQLRFVDAATGSMVSPPPYPPPLPSMPEGSEHFVEFGGLNIMFVGRLDGLFMTREFKDAAGTSGALSILLQAPVRDVEVADLPLHPSKVMEFLGINGRGEDTRPPGASSAPGASAPAAPVKAASPSASPPPQKSPGTPAVAEEAPVIPASVASRLPGQELPPGHWVKAIANANELPDALRVQGVTFKDGWIVPSRPVVWGIIPATGWKAMGVRFRTRVADGRVSAPLLRRHGTLEAEGKAYRFDITTAAAQIQWVDPDIAQPESLLRYRSPMPPLRDGSDHAIEFAVSGDLWVGRMDEVFLAQNLERKIASGGVAILLQSPVCDVEVINFNIFNQDRAKEILGVNNAGEDLR